MNEDIVYVVYDNNGKYIGFATYENDATKMANKYNGYYEAEFIKSTSIFG